ncbi:ATP-binding cassette domain-containing protein [uncultured Ezakiella sp.]|uniref:ATP-binding cassette domain-containing protein n=1 Tax=uncultured Ezakiella sp. TaxID=1637529 RepID=UPI0025D401C1|nr:ATP-binding cassette domain-containing protein [uncultured Ezakiella sp.]
MVISFDGVTKLYKGKLGVENISFDVGQASIAGLIGPNGAGKSTIIKMIAGILTPDSGRLDVMGYEPSRDIKVLSKHYGLMFGNRSSLWFNLKAKESLLLMKDIYNVSDTDYQRTLDKYVEILSAGDLLDKPVRTMSLGERIKIEILTSLIHEPDLLIYDEPTLGLDIQAKLAFREILSSIRTEGKTILITTHDLTDVEKLCDKIILINRGHKLIDLTRTELKEKLAEKMVLTSRTKLDDLKEFFVEEIQGEYKYILPADQAKSAGEFLSTHFDIGSYTFSKPDLEDILYDYYQP